MSLQLPREPQPGDRITAPLVAQIIRYLRSITPRTSAGILVQQGPGGTTLHPRKPRWSTPDEPPFQITDASTTAPAAAKVRVRYGTVKNVVPTIGGAPLSDDPPPALTVVSGVVYLRVELDIDGIVVAATIGNAAALPADTATYGHLTLGQVTVAGGVVSVIWQAITHSLGHQKCGEDVHYFWGM